MTAAAAAYQLYQRPGLLQRVTEWDGNATPGSKRAEAATDDAATAKRTGPEFSFDPFDQASWWKKTDAAPPPSASPPNDAPARTYGFDPFDQASWWKQPTKGSTVDVHA